MRWTTCLVILIGCTVLAGCAGRDFTRPDDASFSLGKTSVAQIKQRFGVPFREGQMVVNDETVTSIAYAFAQVGGASLEPEVIPARTLEFSFHDDVLVGHAFLSSFAQDHTRFDDTKRKELVKGRTTRAQALEALGKPVGAYIYPMISQRDGDADVYLYQTARGSAFDMRFERKLLVVSFDPAGVVSDVKYESSNSAPPPKAAK